MLQNLKWSFPYATYELFFSEESINSKHPVPLLTLFWLCSIYSGSGNLPTSSIKPTLGWSAGRHNFLYLPTKTGRTSRVFEWTRGSWLWLSLSVTHTWNMLIRRQAYKQFCKLVSYCIYQNNMWSVAGISQGSRFHQLLHLATTLLGLGKAPESITGPNTEHTRKLTIKS